MEIKDSDKCVTNEDVENQRPKVHCDICNWREIDANDWDNHVKSRRHQNKLKAKQKPFKSQNQFSIKCTLCGVGFTDEKFYRAHLGTKTHKRNKKRLELKSEVEVDSVHHPAVASFRLSVGKKGRRIGIQDPLLSVVIHKKYKIRSIKTDDLNFRSYIYSLASFLSMRLALNQQVQDFIISVNNKDWGAFGDIVINISYKEKSITYAIQCKKVNQGVRQITRLEEAKVHADKQYENISKLKETWKDSETKFVIFTTCTTTSDFCKSTTISSEILKIWKPNDDIDIDDDATIELKPLTKKNELINVTGDPENVYTFQLKDNVDCELPYLFFYTSQRVGPSMINQLLKLRFDNYPEIAKEYVKYIEDWGQGKLGGNYHLRKKDIILKIGEILLTPYIVSPKKIQSQFDSFDVWNYVIDQVDLTVAKNEPFTISKLCQPLNKIIEETLGTSIDTLTRSINLSSILDRINDTIKPYFFEVVQDQIREDIPLSLIYNIFWKAGKIPLLLSCEDREECKGFILDVICFMKQMGVNKKYLLKSADLNLNHFKDQLNIFSCLDDVKALVNLDEIKIRVSDEYSLSLSTINSTDPFFLQCVTPNMFFDLSLGRYSLAPGNGGKFKGNDDFKIILNDQVKEELEGYLYARPDLRRINSSSHMDEKLRGIDPRLF